MAISIPASQKWLGNDGTWSTFNISLGDETLQLLPSTSGNALWVVHPDGCFNPPFPVAQCAELRGGVFTSSNDASYFYIGETYLPLDPETALGGNYSSSQYSQNASKTFLGSVTATIPDHGGDSFSVQNQAILSFAAKTPYLGMLGLTNVENNVSSTQTLPSLLQSLTAGGQIQSQSWAYTAGAFYMYPPVFGSLTLGGYDAMRGNQENVLTVPFSTGNNRDLVVAINSILIGTSEGLSYNPAEGEIDGLIDSVVPEIWLPLDLCQGFEDAFGLVWNDFFSMYLVNDTQHATLLSQNANVSFQLNRPSTVGQTGPENLGTATIDVTFPYASFDLNASYPLAGIENSSTQWYFPLKRALTPDQVTLGRTFLQQAYVSADYNQSYFNISPALFPQSDSSGPQIITIHRPIKHFRPVGGTVGSLVGLITGLVGGLILVAGLLVFFCPKRKRRSREARNRANMEAADEQLRRAHEEEQRKMKPELDASGTARGPPNERQELGSKEGPTLTELASQEVHEAPTLFEGSEMESNSLLREPSELP